MSYKHLGSRTLSNNAASGSRWRCLCSRISRSVCFAANPVFVAIEPVRVTADDLDRDNDLSFIDPQEGRQETMAFDDLFFAMLAKKVITQSAYMVVIKPKATTA